MTPKEMIEATLQQLKEKRDLLSGELFGYESAITSVEGILRDMGEAEGILVPLGPLAPVPRPPGELGETETPPWSISTDKAHEVLPPAQLEKKQSGKVNESQVRDAIIALSKEPFPPLPPPHTLKDGFFIISQVCDVMGLSSQPNSVRNAIAKFVDKEMLEPAKYKNGSQYRYIPPAETGPGISATVDVSSSRIPTSTEAERRSNGAIAGTGTSSDSLHCSDKDVDKMVKKARSQGFSTARMGSNHIKVLNVKTGKSVTISATGVSSHQAPRVRSDLRGIGVEL